MASSLFNRAPKDSYQELLKLDNTGAGVDSTLRSVLDGSGNATPLELSATQIALNGALWPTSLGSANQVLTTDASGNLSWTTPATVSPAYMQYSSVSSISSATVLNNGSAGSLILLTGSAVFSLNLPALSTMTNGQTITFKSSNTSTVHVNTATADGGSGVINLSNGDYYVLTKTASSWNSTNLSTSGLAGLASPAFTGTPTAPTATAGTNTTQLATTAFVTNAVSGVSGGKYTANNPISSATTVAMGGLYTCTAAGFTVTLPALSGTTNGTYTTVLNGASSGNITIAVTGSDKLWGYFGPQGGVTTMTLYPGESATFVSLPAQAAWDVINYTRITNTAFTGRTQSDAYSYTVVALGSVSGLQTLNLSVASEWTATIAGATTFAFTNTLATGTSEVIYLRLTNAGAFTITWPSQTKFASGAAPTLSTSGVDLLGVKYDTTTSTYMVFVIGLAIA